MSTTTPTDGSCAVTDSDVASLVSTAQVDKTQLKEELLALKAKRDALELEVNDALEFLGSTSVGIGGQLIDKDGFPIGDVDHYAVRSARQKIICGQNDLKALEEELFTKLGDLHDATKEEAQLQMAYDAAAMRRKKEEADKKKARDTLIKKMTGKKPFVEVARVQVNSPAAEAGLSEGQRVVQFGSIDAERVEMEGMVVLAQEAASNEGQVVSVWILEDDEDEDGGNAGREGVKTAKELFLVPQHWSGEGLIGCRMSAL